jgi:hypothetical protein
MWAGSENTVVNKNLANHCIKEEEDFQKYKGKKEIES